MICLQTKKQQISIKQSNKDNVINQNVSTDNEQPESRPELQSQQQFFKASLKFTRKKKIDNYFLFYDDLIGKGSFAKVYKGMNIITNEIVAIKVMQMNDIIQKKLYSLLQAEIQIFKALKHPNIVRCYDILITDNNCYIVTQLCNNGQLNDYLNKIKCNNTGSQLYQSSEIESLVYGVYQGLLYLERKSIIHRDLKLSNVLVKDGVAKIGDFGFASFSKDVFIDAKVGSPIYMSPQAILQNIYSPKTDVWAFGILLYEIFHGYNPFQNCKNHAQLEQKIKIPFSSSKLKQQIPFQIKMLIESCLVYNYPQRPKFKDLWTYQYIKQLRFKNYIQTKKLQFYKVTSSIGSSKKIIISPNDKLLADIQRDDNRSDVLITNKKQNYIKIQEQLNNDLQQEEGYSFQDFLKMNQQQKQFKIDQQKIQPQLEKKYQQKVKQKSLIEHHSMQMQDFYKQAEQMMKEIEKKNQDPIKIIDQNQKCQKYQNLNTQQISKEQCIEFSHNNVIKQMLNNQQNFSLDDQEHKNQTIQSSIEQKLIEICSKQLKFQTQKQSPIQINDQSQLIQISNQNQLLQDSLIQKRQNQSPDPNQQISSNQNKISTNLDDSSNKCIDSSIIIQSVLLQQSPFDKKQPSQKHKSKIKPSIIKFQQSIPFDKNKQTKYNQEHENQNNKQSLDQILLCLQFIRFVLKYLRFCSKLAESVKQLCSEEKTQQDNKIISPASSCFMANSIIQQSYYMIFSSFELRKQVLLEQQLYYLCSSGIMTKITQTLLNFKDKKDLQLLQIIQTHLKLLKNIKNQNPMLNEKDDRHNNQNILPNINNKKQNYSISVKDILQKLYKAMKIVQQPVNSISQVKQKYAQNDKLLIIISNLAWIGIWLTKIYDLYEQIMKIMNKPSKKPKVKVDFDIRLSNVSKQMEKFIEFYDKQYLVDKQIQQNNTNIYYAQNIKTRQNILSFDRIKSNIDYFYQLIYQIQLKRMNEQDH